jgi:hypothetical protein
MASTGSYSENLEETKRKSQQSMLHAFFKQWKDPHPSYAYPFLKHLQPKTNKVKGECKRLCSVECHDLYSSPNIIWVNRSEE